LYAVYTYVKYTCKYMILKIDIEKNIFFIASTVHNKGTFDEDP